jgi:hypothetical protein
VDACLSRPSSDDGLTPKMISDETLSCRVATARLAEGTTTRSSVAPIVCISGTEKEWTIVGSGVLRPLIGVVARNAHGAERGRAELDIVVHLCVGARARRGHG